MSVFDKVANFMEARKQSASAEWTSTVADIANGKDPTPAKVEELLNRTGKTLDDLKAAVDVKMRRKALRAALDAVPALQRDVAELDRLYDAEAMKLQSAQARFNEATRPLIDRANELREKIAQGEAARGDLINKWPDEQTALELNDAEQARNPIHRRIAALREAVRQGEAGYQDMEAANRQLNRKAAAEMKADAQRKIDEANGCQDELDKATRELAEAEERVVEIRERMLIP